MTGVAVFSIQGELFDYTVSTRYAIEAILVISILKVIVNNFFKNKQGHM